MRLNESQLRKIVSESINAVLNEQANSQALQAALAQYGSDAEGLGSDIAPYLFDNNIDCRELVHWIEETYEMLVADTPGPSTATDEKSNLAMAIMNARTYENPDDMEEGSLGMAKLSSPIQQGGIPFDTVLLYDNPQNYEFYLWKDGVGSREIPDITPEIAAAIKSRLI